MEMLLDQLVGLDIIQYAAIPAILLFVLEWVFTIVQKKEYYNRLDTISATFIGLVNVSISALLKIGIFGIILFFYNLVPWHIPSEWWAYLLSIIAIDFSRYWTHRLTHVNHFWWATHVTHHNSEKYNLSVAFRLSWTQHIKFIFLIPIVVIGFNPVLFFKCHQIEILCQFWIYTEYIRKLPAPIEYIFVTPSHQRVHPSTNDKYLDKTLDQHLLFGIKYLELFKQRKSKPIMALRNQLIHTTPSL